jgi:ubiquinone/menaquinone biosynthesis C-methylase UbiE
MDRAELDRITRIYRERQARDVQALYAPDNAAQRFMSQRRETAVMALLHRAGLRDFRPLHILDIGCGRGLGLADWMRWGAQAERLAGIDVVESFIGEARARIPGATLAVAAGDQLPFASGTFDIVAQFTVFTSILDPDLRRHTAHEMRRVLRRGGLILWYDFRTDNPNNRNVRGVGRGELARLFADCIIEHRSLTLAPPIARFLGSGVFSVGAALEALPFLRTHYLATIRQGDIT